MMKYLESNGWERATTGEWFHMDYHHVEIREYRDFTGIHYALYVNDVSLVEPILPTQVAAIIKSIYHFT